MHKLIRITTIPISIKLLITSQMSYMKDKGFDVLAISSDGKEISDIEKIESVPHVIIPMTRSITPIQDLKCLFLMYRLFKKEKPTIVHTHTPKAGLLGMIAAKLSRVPIRIHTIAGLPLMTTKGPKRKLLENIEKITCWGAQEIWPNSQSIYNFMIDEKLCKKSKMKIVGKGSSNGIDLNVFTKEKLNNSKLECLKTEIEFNKDNIYLLAVGRIVKDKGIIELINAFIELKKSNSLLQLILLGPIESERKEELLPFDILNEIKTNKAILHINWSDDVAYYMGLTDVLIHASHREGFPNVVLQAGAMKLSIICSDIPGNIDIVEHLKTGYLFEKGNIPELVKGLDWILKNKNLVKQYSTHLRSEIEQYYERNAFHGLILDEYNRLLNRE